MSHRTVACRLSIAASLALLAAAPGLACSGDVPAGVRAAHAASPLLARFDSDCDGDLSAAELRSVRQTALAEARREVRPAPALGLLPVAPAAVPVAAAPAQTLSLAPPPSRRTVHIGRDRMDTMALAATGVLQPFDGYSAARGGALSFYDDRERRVQTANIDGVLTWTPLRRTPNGPAGLAWSLGTTLDIQGQISTEDDDPSQITAALDFGLELPGRAIDRHMLSFGPYYQSDLEKNAEVIGVRASWMPVNAGWNLGMGTDKPGSALNRLLWQTSLNADFAQVTRAGETALEDDAQYAWLGVSSSFTIYPFGGFTAQRPFVQLGGDAWVDAAGGETTLYGTAGLGFPLTMDGDASLLLNYEYGDIRQTLQRVDRLAAELQVRF